MSKLFNISLNELLQVELPEGQQPAPADGAPVSSPGPRRGDLVWKLLSGVLALCVVLLWAQVGQLASRVEQLEVQAAAPAGLDPSAPLVGDFNYEFSGRNGIASFKLDLLSRQVVDGVTVSFTLIDGTGEVRTAEGEAQPGGHYTASLAMSGAVEPLTVSASFFTEDGVEYPVPLVRIGNYDSSSWAWELLWKDQG